MPDQVAVEAVVRSHSGALAAELDVSRWVIEAWEREAECGRGLTCVA